MAELEAAIEIGEGGIQAGEKLVEIGKDIAAKFTTAVPETIGDTTVGASGSSAGNSSGFTTTFRNMSLMDKIKVGAAVGSATATVGGVGAIIYKKGKEEGEDEEEDKIANFGNPEASLNAKNLKEQEQLASISNNTSGRSVKNDMTSQMNNPLPKPNGNNFQIGHLFSDIYNTTSNAVSTVVSSVENVFTTTPTQPSQPTQLTQSTAASSPAPNNSLPF